MKFIRSAILIIAVLVFPAVSTFAQENEPQVVDEAIAQVNDGVITLSQVKREMKDIVDSDVQQNKMSEDAAKKDVESKKGELIAGLINEELLMQKGKDIENLEKDVDAEINSRFLSIMKEQGLKTLDALYEAMRKQGVNPDDLREGWRRQITKDMVLQNECDRKVYLGWSASEVKKYYEAHKDKFLKPETVTISEIFLNFAGRDQDALKAKAYQLVSQLRKGEDFGKLAIENSDRPDAKDTKGRIGSLTLQQIKETSDIFVAPIQATKEGGVTDPVITQEGIEIFRVDERKAATNEAFFDENLVRSEVTREKLPEARKKYMSDLRKDSYVKISKSYYDLVMPILTKDDVTAEVKSSDKKEADNKKPENKKKNQ